MNNQNPAQVYEQELKKALEAELFPNDALPDDFNETKNLALYNESLASLNCNLETLASIVKKKEDFTLYELSFMVNAIQARTPDQLSVSLNAYIELQTKINLMAEVWNTMVTPIKNSLFRKLSVMNNLTKGVPKLPFGKA